MQIIADSCCNQIIASGKPQELRIFLQKIKLQQSLNIFQFNLIVKKFALTDWYFQAIPASLLDIQQ